MIFGPEPLQMVWKHYEPGEELPGITINALTTLAASYASSVFHAKLEWLEDKSMGGAIAVSNLLWARHVRPDHPFELPLTHPASFLPQESSRPETGGLDAQFLGLFHVGLSRLAMEYSLREYGSVHGLSVGKVLQILAQDMQDLSLDGTKNGELLYLTRHEGLSDMFLRFELAAAIRNWLRSQALASDKPARLNTTSFDARELSRPGRFLRTLAIDRSKLFGERGGREFDMDGPEIAVRFENNMRQAVDPSFGHRGPLHIYVTATDDSKVVSLTARLGENALRTRGPMHNGYAEYAFNSEEHPDGEYDLVLEAVDEYGNEAFPVVRKILIDNTAPRVQLEDRSGDASLWIGGQGDLHLLGELDEPCESLRLVGPGVPDGLLLKDLQAGRFELRAQLACNATYHATLEATDYAGNVGHMPVHIYCDATPPTSEATSVGFTHERSLVALYLDQRGWSTSTPEFEKHFNRLDYLPPEKNKDMGNLPAARFRVSDASNGLSGLPGADAKDLKVEYRYVYEGHLGAYVRDWEALSNAAPPAAFDGGAHGRLSSDEYQVVISYQTLLPRSILDGGLQHARVNNFLARSKKTDRHRIEVRVTDLAGNVSSPQVFEFRLDLFSPDVTVDGCGITNEARNISLAGMTIPTVYSGQVPLMDARVSWTLDRPGLSLTPDGRLLVAAQAGGFASRMLNLEAERTQDGPDYGYEQRMEKKRCPHQWNHRIVWEEGNFCEHAGTNEHKYPQSWVAEMPSTSHQSADFAFVGGSQAANGAFYLAGSDQVRLQMRVAGHLLSHNKTPYTWPTHGQKYFLARYRGAEIHNEPPFRYKFVPFTQTHTLKSLEIRRLPVNFVLTGTEGGIPGPKSIVHAPACTRGALMTWDRDKGFIG